MRKQKDKKVTEKIIGVPRTGKIYRVKSEVTQVTGYIRRTKNVDRKDNRAARDGENGGIN